MFLRACTLPTEAKASATVTTMTKTGRKKDARHQLIRSVRGGNQHVPGYYLCKCGEEFTGYNAWERHRADENKKLRETNS